MSWAEETTDPRVKDYWREKVNHLAADVHSVDPYDDRAIEAKRAELREIFQSLPEEAPEIGL